MKIVLFLLFPVLFSHLNNAQLSNESLKELSSKTVEKFFQKYTNSSDFISPDHFQSFLNKFLRAFNHDHEHNDIKSHHHHENEPVKQKDQTKCFDKKITGLKELSGKQSKLEPESFGQLSAIFVTIIDSCVLDRQDLDVISKKENWIFAFLSALIITIIGLLCYLVVPSLNTFCFNYLFQFLVALAVGTLTGDALLHLIPHAFSSHDHSHGEESIESHHEGVYKGLGAVVGIYVFFLIEKIMQMRRARKEKRHIHDELTGDQNDHNQVHHNDHERVLDDNDNSTIVLTGSKINQPGNADDLGAVPKRGDNDEPDCIVIHANKDLKYISKYLPNNKCAENIDHHDHENEIQHLHQHKLGFISKDGDHEVEVKTFTKNKHSEDESSSRLSIAHGHSHGHKYQSSREKAHHDHHMKHEREITDIKLIAWMVLMGDGLHNFADGLAIGASFASSLTTGFGTSIAVLCHELPHEIGDFAVLRRAGVSLRRALVFNALSGVLCCIGTFVGLIIGSYPAFSNLTFMFIAGVFLYISLVDMIPELSENKDDDSIVNFCIQSFGILAGICIMLAIALLEDKIIHIFRPLDQSIFDDSRLKN